MAGCTAVRIDEDLLGACPNPIQVEEEEVLNKFVDEDGRADTLVVDLLESSQTLGVSVGRDLFMGKGVPTILLLLKTLIELN